MLKLSSLYNSRILQDVLSARHKATKIVPWNPDAAKQDAPNISYYFSSWAYISKPS